MAQKWKEVWSNRLQNGTIALSTSQSFGVSTTDEGNRKKYGSMNTLFLTNRSDSAIKIELDGNIYTELFGNASLVIEANDGIYFDLIKVTELDGVEIPASKISVRYGRSMLVS